MIMKLAVGFVALVLSTALRTGESSLRRRMDEDGSLKLEPFQILFVDAGDDTDLPLDEMALLEMTRTHLIRSLNISSEVSRLSLYKSMQPDENDGVQVGPRVAFGGKIYFMDAVNRTEEELVELQYLCFLGDNATEYVGSLQTLGWEDLEQAQLLTVGGELVEYVNGTISIEEMQKKSPEMDDSMSRIMYLSAVLIPLSIITAICAVLFLLRAKHTLASSSAKADPESPVWKRQHPEAIEFQRQDSTLNDSSQNQRRPSDSLSDGASDLDSVQVAVPPKRSKDRRPK